MPTEPEDAYIDDAAGLGLRDPLAVYDSPRPGSEAPHLRGRPGSATSGCSIRPRACSKASPSRTGAGCSSPRIQRGETVALPPFDAVPFPLDDLFPFDDPAAPALPET